MIEGPPIDISRFVATHGRHRGKRTAFVFGDRRVSWGEFDRRVNKVANALLGDGLTRGDKVALLGLNCVETLEIMFGTIRAGGVVVPPSVMLTPKQIAALLEDSLAKFTIVVAPLQALITPVQDEMESIAADRRIAVGFSNEGWKPYREFIKEASETDPDVPIANEDDCVIIYSSGTTGVPKGIVHSHQARTLFAYVGATEFRIDDAATALVNTPVFSNATWLFLLGTIAVGGISVLAPQFTPGAFFAAVERERCTHAFLVPTQFHTILEHGDFDRHDLSSLKIMVSMGSALPLSLKNRILDRMGTGLIELYGVTEGIGTTLKPEDILTKTGSVGTPISSVEMRIIDGEGRELPVGETGEVVGRCAAMMKGDHNRPEATEQVLWRDGAGRMHLKTGDIGRFDEDGFLYILDRKKDMIVSGGINVYPKDIEEVMTDHPDVFEVAVFAVPDDKWGETPMALVRLRECATVSESELMAWTNERVGKHQRVRRLEFHTDEFPRNPLGKLLKRKLREPYWGGQS